MSVLHGNRIRQRITRNVFSAKIRRQVKFDRFTANLLYYTRIESSYFYIIPPSPSALPRFPVIYAASPGTLKLPYLCTKKKTGRTLLVQTKLYNNFYFQDICTIIIRCIFNYVLWDTCFHFFFLQISKNRSKYSYSLWVDVDRLLFSAL